MGAATGLLYGINFPTMAALPASTRFAFHHRAFAVPGARFVRHPESGAAVFECALGNVRGALDLAVLKTNFEIGDSDPDGELLGVVERSLPFVKEIRPGDDIPREVLDGSASWSVSAEHRERALDRLLLHLAAWQEGGEADTADPSTFATRLAASEMQEIIGAGLDRAASALGRDNGQRVRGELEELARELAYIEALRDGYAPILVLPRRLVRLLQGHRRDRTLMEEIDRVQRLLRAPIGGYQQMFEEIFAQVSDILATLRNRERQVEFVRTRRNDLHVTLMEWGAVVRAWGAFQDGDDAAVAGLIRTTYRFAAMHFLEVYSWRSRDAEEVVG